MKPETSGALIPSSHGATLLSPSIHSLLALFLVSTSSCLFSCVHQHAAASVQYLELSLLVWSERLPLWRVEELVAVDVVQELALQRYADPARR